MMYTQALVIVICRCDALQAWQESLELWLATRATGLYGSDFQLLANVLQPLLSGQYAALLAGPLSHDCLQEVLTQAAEEGFPGCG